MAIQQLILSLECNPMTDFKEKPIRAIYQLKKKALKLFPLGWLHVLYPPDTNLYRKISNKFVLLKVMKNYWRTQLCS